MYSATSRKERWRGFFKGLSPYLLHVTPNICLVFLIYEKVGSHHLAWTKAERDGGVTPLAVDTSLPPPSGDGWLAPYPKILITDHIGDLQEEFHSAEDASSSYS